MVEEKKEVSIGEEKKELSKDIPPQSHSTPKPPEETKDELIAVKQVTDFIKINKKTLLYILPFFGLLFAIIIGLYIRTRNFASLGGQHMLELDSYLFYRYAKYIVENGSLFSVDTMRYVPIYFKTIPSYSVFPYFMAYAYKIIKIFLPSLPQIIWHQLYPPIIFSLSLIPLFLFLRNVFDNITAVLSVIFLTIVPGYLQRTISGFADHESLAMFLMFSALWFFVKAFKAKNIKKDIIFSLLSGILSIFMLFVWGGGVFLLASISLFFLAIYFLESYDIRYLRILSLWSLPTILAVVLGFIPLRDFRLAPLYFALLIYIAEYIFHKINLINKVKLLQKYQHNQKIIYSVLAILFLIIVNFVLKLVTLRQIMTAIRTPLTAERVGQTVSENSLPFFSDFARNMGVWFITPNTGLWLIYFSLLGAIVLFYHILSSRKLPKLPFYLYVLLIVVLMFDRYNPQSKTNALFAKLFLPAIVIFVISIIWFYIKATKTEKTRHELEHINFMYLLLIIWFTISFIISKGAIRIVFAMIPPFSIMAAYSFSFLFNFAQRQKNNVVKIIGTLVVLVLVIGLVSSNSKILIQQAQYSGPGFTGPWQEVCDWIKQNTNESDVFSHWWDYGYFIQTACNRATVTDGGNFYSFWNHFLGRHLLLAYTSEEALTFAKTHNAKYLLIAPEEIGKMHAFAYIGSDENLDKQTSIGTFVYNPQYDQELRNGTRRIFVGGWALDKDFIYKNRVFPKNGAALGAIAFNIDDRGKATNANAIILYAGTQSEVPLACICEDPILTGEKEAKCQQYNTTTETFPGCFLFMPSINAQTQTINPREIGFWISEKNMKTLFVNLYLLNKTWDGFELAYIDPKRPLAFVNGNQIGPIKVWKMNWDENTPTNETWLLTSGSYNW